MTNITETIGRSAVLANATNYNNVTEALREIIDNPFDKRRGRHLTIDIQIDKKGDRITIMDHGGEGMNDEGLQEWIRWGGGSAHSAKDIGQYKVGGKAAAAYLAESLEIICRKSGEAAIWRFYDPHWASRTETVILPVTEIDEEYICGNIDDDILRSGIGFTCVTLTELKKRRRYEIGVIREEIADTYRTLIEEGNCTIRVDGKDIKVRSVPWSSSIDVVEIPKTKVFPGVSIEGKVGAIDRDRLPDTRGVRFRAGIRTEFNGRKITHGEEFGFNLSGKGNLQRVYGEISIKSHGKIKDGRGLLPNQLKNGWDYDSDAWTAIEDCISTHMRPVVTHLANISESRSESREERKRASSAHRRLRDAFQMLERLNLGGNSGGGENVGPGGRQSPSRTGDRTSTDGTARTRSATKNPTPAPRDAVGRLVRQLGGMPRVTYDALGEQTPRTQWRDEENGKRSIVINKDYPLYTSLGNSEDYIFESAAMHLTYDEAPSLDEARELFDQLVWLDHERHRG